MPWGSDPFASFDLGLGGPACSLLGPGRKAPTQRLAVVLHGRCPPTLPVTASMGEGRASPQKSW